MVFKLENDVAENSHFQLVFDLRQHQFKNRGPQGVQFVNDQAHFIGDYVILVALH